MSTRQDQLDYIKRTAATQEQLTEAHPPCTGASEPAAAPTPRSHFSEAEIETIWQTDPNALCDLEYRKVFEQAITAYQLERELAEAKSDRDATARMNGNLLAKVEALKVDAERYRWAKPILDGSDDKIADRRAMALALKLSEGLSGDAAIDAARGER